MNYAAKGNTKKDPLGHANILSAADGCIQSVTQVGTERAAYWPPSPGVPAFRMEVAAAKIRAALWLGISFSVFSQC